MEPTQRQPEPGDGGSEKDDVTCPPSPPAAQETSPAPGFQFLEPVNSPFLCSQGEFHFAFHASKQKGHCFQQVPMTVSPSPAMPSSAPGLPSLEWESV